MEVEWERGGNSTGAQSSMKHCLVRFPKELRPSTYPPLRKELSRGGREVCTEKEPHIKPDKLETKVTI